MKTLLLVRSGSVVVVHESAAVAQEPHERLDASARDDRVHVIPLVARVQQHARALARDRARYLPSVITQHVAHALRRASRERQSVLLFARQDLQRLQRGDAQRLVARHALAEGEELKHEVEPVLFRVPEVRRAFRVLVRADEIG